jgi:hypothetical protein
MAIPLLALCVHPKIWKIQNIYLTRTNFLIQMSEFKDGLLKLNLKKDKQRLEKVLLILEDVKLRLKIETVYDVTPRGRAAAYDVTPRGEGAANEITLGRREAVAEDIQAAFAERDAAFERRLLDVDHRKKNSQHQPDTEMLARSSVGAGIDLATEIASSQVGVGIDLHDEDENDVQIFNLMQEDIIVLPDTNKFSSWLKLIGSAAWMYRFIKKTQKLTRTEEMEWAKIRWYKV